MRERLRDRLRHPDPPGGGGADVGRAGLSRTFLPAPVARRSGWERASFVFFLLAAGLVFGPALANISLVSCLVFTLAWRTRVARAGGDFWEPFRRRTPLHGVIGAFVVLSILSCFFSTLPARSLIQIKGFGTFLLVPFTLAQLRDEDDVHLLLDVWRLTALYLVARGLLEYVAGKNNLDERLSGGMSVYMTYAGLLMSLSLLLLSRGLSAFRGVYSRVADVAVAISGIVAVSLTLTRNAYLGLGAGLLALFALSRPRLALLVPVGGVAFLMLMPVGVWERALSSFDPNDETVKDRFVMWRAGAGMIADRPLFGVGPARVKALYPVYRREGFVDPHPGHLHNNLVMIAAETGIPSLLAYLGFLAAFASGAVRRNRERPLAVQRSVIRGSVAVVAALTVAGLFEYNFGDVELLMTILIVASLPFALPPPGGALESAPA